MHIPPIYCGQVAFASTLALKVRMAPGQEFRPDCVGPSSTLEISTKTRYRRRARVVPTIDDKKS
jgi:hypothetical protein